MTHGSVSYKIDTKVANSSYKRKSLMKNKDLCKLTSVCGGSESTQWCVRQHALQKRLVI